MLLLRCLTHPHRFRPLLCTCRLNCYQLFNGIQTCTPPCSFQDLEEYNPADMVQSLCRMISYNIGQLAYLNAKR